MRTLALALLTASAASAAAAQPPEHLDALEREMRIMQKVFTAALRDAEGPRTRVRDVQVGYLAEQGVLIDVSLRRGWFGSYHRVVEIDADGDVSMAMPSMVRDILMDLEIPLGPVDAEAFEAVREERRELRRERRELRGKLRELRRQAPLDDEGKAALEKLRAEQEALRAEQEALRADLRDQYAQVHVVREQLEDDGEAGDAGDESGEDALGFDAMLVGAICDYGATLKSLPEDERLSVQVRRRGQNAFHVFTFADVLECAAGDLTPAELLEQGIVYSTAGERRHARHHRYGRHHDKGGHRGPHGKAVFRWEAAPDAP